jgi:exopolyphosphatase/guanosine-5'-triphosphate,3'-diphosphate pyrophosphatase
MRALVMDSFAAFVDRLPQRGVLPLRLLGTSGTVTTLASVHLGLEIYDRRQIDGLHILSSDLRDISTNLANLSVPDRAVLPCIGPERADLVVAGCAILEVIFDIWPAERVGVADRGIREGILRQLMTSGNVK